MRRESINLNEMGLLLATIQVLTWKKINFHVKAFIQVQLGGLAKTRILPHIQQIPNVIECNCVTGDYSEIMEVVFPSTTD